MWYDVRMKLPTSHKSGIYRIVCTTNGKTYVGSAAKSIKGRAACHLSLLQSGEHPNVYLQRAWQKHGEDAFEFFVLEHCSPEDCVVREQHWIDTLKSTYDADGYNICKIAGSRQGCVLSEESKEKIALTKRGRKASETTRKKMSEAQKNRVLSQDHLDKLRANHWKNRPDAEDVKARISKAHTGRKRSLEQCLAIKRSCKKRDEKRRYKKYFAASQERTLFDDLKESTP